MRRISPGQSEFLYSVRGISALWVAGVHALQIFYGSAPYVVAQIGTVLLLAFFAQSGFLIHKSLRRLDPAAFARARARRLLPPFIFAIGLTAILGLLTPAVKLTGLVPTLLFVNGFFGPTMGGNPPLWSLAYEVWLYTIAGLAAVGTKRTPGLLVAASLAALAVHLSPGFLFYGGAWAAGYAASAIHDRRGLWIPDVRLPAAELLGRSSYTMFITHFPIMLALREAGWSDPWIALAACVAAAIWAARYLESHQRSSPARVPEAGSTAAPAGLNAVTVTTSAAVARADSSSPAVSTDIVAT